MTISRDGQDEDWIQELNDLSSLVLNILGSSSALLPIPFTSDKSIGRTTARRTSSSSLSWKQASPGCFACLLLGISLTLMLCGSVTFVIGFILMPWVVGFLLLFYVLGVLSTLSSFGRAILYPPSPKEIAAWNFS